MGDRISDACCPQNGACIAAKFVALASFFAAYPISKERVSRHSAGKTTRIHFMRKNLIIIILLGILTLLYFAPVILSHKTFIARDNYIFFNPRRFFAAESLRSGTLPLWNPFLACGVPFQANLQSSLFYPLAILYYLLPFQLGFKYFIVVHYFLGSLFMFLLMREWDSDRFTALLSGIVFAFGGYLISILDNVAFLTAAVWLPLILLFFHRALQGGSFFYALLCGIAIALQILAGDASFYLLSTFSCTFLYTIIWPMIKPESPHHTIIKPWALLACSWCSGMLLASVQLIPFVEFILHSTRFEGYSFAKVTKWSYHPLELLQLLIPYIFGPTVPSARWFGQRWLDTFYIGIFPLIFSVFFIFYCNRKIKYYLFLLLFCALLLSMGQYNPLFLLLYNNMPGMDMLMYPVKLLFPASFCLAIMAGMGASHFLVKLDQKDSLKGYLQGLTFFFLLLVGILSAGAVFFDQLYGYFLAIYPKTAYMQALQKDSFLQMFKGLSVAIFVFASFILVSGAAMQKRLKKSLFMFLVIAITFADLTFIGKTKEPYLDEAVFTRKNRVVDFLQKDTSMFRTYSLVYIANKRSFLHLPNIAFEKVYRGLQEGLLPNLNMYYHLPSIDEYAAILNKAYYQIFSPVEIFFTKDKPSLEEQNYCDKMLDLLNVKYIVSPKALTDKRFPLLLDGPMKIYENPGVLPRAFFIKKLLVVETEDDVLQMMEQPSFNPAEMGYITVKDIQKLQGAFLPDADTHQKEAFVGTVEFLKYLPNLVTIKTKSNQSAFLILADNYYPGWQVFINGEEKPLLKVNYILRGILLAKGENQITFAFKPQSFRIGASLSIVALGVVLFSLITLRRNGVQKFST